MTTRQEPCFYCGQPDERLTDQLDNREWLTAERMLLELREHPNVEHRVIFVPHEDHLGDEFQPPGEFYSFGVRRVLLP